MKTISISIIKKSKKWDTPTAKAMAIQATTKLATLEPTLKKLKKISFSIELADNKRLQGLKKAFFGIDAPTNVLSFPSQENLNELLLDEEGYLGDIAISYSKVYNESSEQGKMFDAHLMHLIIHSILHLIGYDHIKPNEARKMEGLEIKVLSLLGINNPYE